MGLLVLVNRNKPVLGSLVLDASLQEVHAGRVRKTKNPRQDGTIGTDHAQVEPRVVQVTGAITSSPDVLLAFTRPQYNNSDRHLSAWQELEAMLEGRELHDVFTTLKSYTSMMLIGLSTTRTASNSNGLQFLATFEKTEIARSLLVENLAADVSDLAQAEADLGAQGTTTEAA